MNGPGSLFEGYGNDGFSTVPPDQGPPRIFTPQTNEDFHKTPTSSWITSLGSIPPGGGQDTDYVSFQGMDLDMMDSADAGLESLSTSPNSILSRIEEFPVDHGWIDLAKTPHTTHIQPNALHANQTHIETYAPIDNDHDTFHCDHDPRSRNQRPVIHPDSHQQWPANVRPSMDQRNPFPNPYFSPSTTTFLSQNSAQEPWNVFHPRNENPATTDVVIFDSELEGASFRDDCSRTSSECHMTSGAFDCNTPLSSHSMQACSSASPTDCASFVDVGAFPSDPQESNIRQVFRSGSSFSSDTDFMNASPPPHVAFQNNHYPGVAAQPTYGPTVKSEYPSVCPPSSSASPRISQASYAHQYYPAETIAQDIKPSNMNSAIGRTNNNRPGGRPLGSHLLPEVAADASMMRKVVACWHCVLQRDKCGPGEVCDRCRKRLLRPNTEYGLGCSRISVRELAEFFLPSLMTSIHEHETLRNFCAKHVGKWENVELKINLACGRGLPSLPCRVYEFRPLDGELLRSYHYHTDIDTGKRRRDVEVSPPLGIQQQSPKDKQDYEHFINIIVNNYLPHFSYMLYERERNDFALRLFRLMINLKPREPEEDKLLKEVFRLIVVTYIMAHTFVITEHDKDTQLSRLKSYRPGIYPYYCSPRMTNRQIKHLFCHLHQKIIADLLNRLQQIFRSSGKGSPRWTEAFCAVLGLAIANEEVQKSIHINMDARSALGEFTKEVAMSRAEDACREIDQRFQFVMNIFRWKYSRNENPLRDSNQDWSSKLKDPVVVEFTKNVVLLVTEKLEYLRERQYVDIADANQEKYTSRLVARFLLAFWNPT